MVFLGFLLVAAAITVGVGIVLDNTDPANLVLFGQTVPALENEWQVFLAGAGVALVLVCGLTLTFMGAARRVRDRRDLRDLREEHEESLTTLEMEKRRLQRELARVKQSGPRQAPPREPAVQGVRVAGRPAGNRSQIPATSPFFDRAE
ncbi:MULTISPECIES: hypothetical protein [Actinomadura]|uniref:Lipopolysaccharide assembly protein A domain-containing protein n=1 Tax=Actinomadura madurae TaxID=1993 RepID=A0A1I5M0J2_9ACTN|nr:hypothetical protein [Actinomadura madurae]SFP03114.1 hypothetical protein SAMN04489713_111106 [Actinomadura madurae]SPT52282.1 Uncharacterised protein [Actinomadura madurae]